jgi:N-formylmaleamate deformylase
MSPDAADEHDHAPLRIEEVIGPLWSEETLTANGVRQHYFRSGRGDGKPALALLHGFSENGLCWSRVARALENQYDLLLLDARGHGHTDLPATAYSPDALTQDVVAFIAALGLERPFLWGYSNGGKTAAAVAASAPDAIRAVILEDPPWRAESAETNEPARPAANVTGSKMGDEPWPGYAQWRASFIGWHVALRGQTFAERVASSSAFLPPGALDWPQEELLTHLEAQAQFNLDLLEMLPPVPLPSPWRATVKRISCPILLLTSDPARGGTITPGGVEQITASWRDGEHVAFPGASHFLHHEMRGAAFARFIETIQAFLARA